MQPEELLQYLPQFRIIICHSCQYAIQPTGVTRHLKEIHQIYRSARRPFLDFVSKIDLADPNDVPVPSADQFPVTGLSVEDGYACRSPGCQYLCITSKRMKWHWSNTHKRPGLEAEDWAPAPLQTFFRGNQLRYFSNFSGIVPHSGSQTWLLGNASFNDQHAHIIAKLQSRLNAEEAFLFRHFNVSTAHTLSDNDELLAATRELAVTLSDNYQFVLDGVIACAALHIAHYDQAQREEKTLRGAFYQNRAIEEFRLELRNVTEANCSAILIFSHFLCVFAFTSAREAITPEGSFLSKVPSLFNFVKGTSVVIFPVKHLVEAGPTKAMVTPDRKVLEGDSAEVDPMVKIVLSASTAYGYGDRMAEGSQIYQDTILELRRAYYCYRLDNAELNIWDAVFWWPPRLPTEFLGLIERREPLALICLAYYCVFLTKIEHFWYLSGWGRGLLQEIWFSLDENGRRWIQSALDDLKIVL